MALQPWRGLDGRAMAYRLKPTASMDGPWRGNLSRGTQEQLKNPESESK
jgi:hypothetical protein